MVINDVGFNLSIIFSLIGIIMFIYSGLIIWKFLPLIPNKKLRWGWKINIFLILIFTIGYLINITALILNLTILLIYMQAFVYLFGALFVLIVITLSYNTYNFILKSTKNHEQQKLYLDQILKVSHFKTEFLATMSHELRTPLNSIIGFTELLLERSYGQLNKDQLEFLKDIKLSSNHLVEMVNNVLDISKIEFAQYKLNIQKFSLNDLINQFSFTIKPFYLKKNLIFKVKGLKSEVMIYADPIKFKEILYNLFNNAIKFTKEGEIIFDVQENGDYWLFKIMDTGIGISFKDFDLIFKDFKRVDSPYVKSTPGAGLGLSLTRRLINLHGGDIWIESELGKGTTFYFTIPKESVNLIN